MSDEEILVHLADKVMGFSVGEDGYARLGVYPRLDFSNYGGWPVLHTSSEACRRWNPLESPADAFEVQAAILAGPKATQYILRMHDMACGGVAVVGQRKLYAFLLTATPRQRCLAIVEATR